MKKNRLKLTGLNVTSFVPASKIRGGLANYEPIMTPPERESDTCLCGPTYWEGCQETQ